MKKITAIFALLAAFSFSAVAQDAPKKKTAKDPNVPAASKPKAKKMRGVKVQPGAKATPVPQAVSK